MKRQVMSGMTFMMFGVEDSRIINTFSSYLQSNYQLKINYLMSAAEDEDDDDRFLFFLQYFFVVSEDVSEVHFIS